MRISDWSSDVCSSDLEDLAATELCLLAVPAQALRGVADALAPVLGPRVPLVLCAKGIEAVSGLLMTEVTAEALPGRPLAVLSGPTFAAEDRKSTRLNSSH